MHIPPPPTASGPHKICPLRGATRHHPPSTLPPTLHIPGPLHPTSPHCCSATPPQLPAQPHTPTDPPRRWRRHWRQGQVMQASHMTWPISSSSDDANPRPTYDPCPALTPPSPSTTRPRLPSPPPTCHQPLPSTCRCHCRFPTVTHPHPRRTRHAQHVHHRPCRHAPLSSACRPRMRCPAPPSGFFLGKSNPDRSHCVNL